MKPTYFFMLHRLKFHAACATPELEAPHADTAELAAYLARFLAAFKSRSMSLPQSHTIRRDDSGIMCIKPQLEHVLLLGNQRSTMTTFDPLIFALYSICRLSSPKPPSMIERARQWFCTIPDTFKSSIATVPTSVVRRVVSLCAA